MPSLATSTSIDVEVKYGLLTSLLNLIGIVPFSKQKQVLLGDIRGKVCNGAVDHPAKECSDTGTKYVERMLLLESEEELSRSGGFDRIYPTAITRELYDKYFLVPRSLNGLLHSWEERKTRITQRN